MNNKSKKTKELPEEVIGALADAFGKSFITIKRWVESNDDRLTSEKARRVFENKNITWNQATEAA